MGFFRDFSGIQPPCSEILWGILGFLKILWDSFDRAEESIDLIL